MDTPLVGTVELHRHVGARGGRFPLGTNGAPPIAMRIASLCWSIALGLLGCSTPSSAPGDDGPRSATSGGGEADHEVPEGPDASVSAMTPGLTSGAASAAGDASAPAPVGHGADGGSGAGFAYSEDFESYDAGAIPARFAPLGPWTVSTDGTVTATIDGVRPHAGKSSMHVIMPVGGQASAMLVSATVPTGLVPGNNLFGRAMIYFVETPGDGGVGLPLMTHWWIFSTAGSSNEVGGPVSVNMDGNGDINYQPRSGTTFELEAPGGTLSTNAWHCIQWEYDGSEHVPLVVEDHARVWIDGQQVTDVPKSEGWFLATPWTSFQFGLTHRQATVNPVEYFMDDIALDGATVACP